MPAITLKGIPEDLMERLRTLADEERRSLNQQAILLLERAIAEEPRSFSSAYRQFRERHGTSPLEEGDLEGLRSRDPGRSVRL
jgi:hypothetical protein